MYEKALIIVDAQYDFMPGGSLPIDKGDEIVPYINSIMLDYPRVIFTQDWHPDNHCSFKNNGGLWPKHCVENTFGASIHKDFLKVPHYTVKKGMNKEFDSYSGFFDDGGNETDLINNLLYPDRITHVDICGLATDYCVRATVIDALNLKLTVNVLSRGCRGVSQETVEKAMEEMKKAGAIIL